MITGEKVSLTHIQPFGCLLYIAKGKEQMSNTKLNSQAIATAYMGSGYLQGRKCERIHSGLQEQV